MRHNTKNLEGKWRMHVSALLQLYNYNMLQSCRWFVASEERSPNGASNSHFGRPVIFFRGFLSAANWYLRFTLLNHVNDHALKSLPHSTSQLEGRLIVQFPLLQRKTLSRTNLVTRLAVMSITIATTFQGQLPSSGFSYYNGINSFQVGWIGQHGDMQRPCVTIVKIHGTGFSETKNALYLSVNVFSTRVQIEDNIFKSLRGEATTIFWGHASHAKV